MVLQNHWGLDLLTLEEVRFCVILNEKYFYAYNSGAIWETLDIVQKNLDTKAKEWTEASNWYSLCFSWSPWLNHPFNGHSWAHSFITSWHHNWPLHFKSVTNIKSRIRSVVTYKPYRLNINLYISMNWFDSCDLEPVGNVMTKQTPFCTRYPF